MRWIKYGTQSDIRFTMVKRAVVDLAASADWTPAAADSAISKDGGNLADTTNTVAAVSSGTATRSGVDWKLTITATEAQAAEINIQIVDAATKAVEDQFLTVYTYGNASAKFAGDWSDIVRLGLTALPNAAAGANGGLLTCTTGNVLPTGAIAAASFVAGAIDATAIAADAIGSSELAASAVTEIQAGLSTLDAAAVRAAVGLASANLDTQIAAVQADTDNIQTRLPAALVGGRMDSSTGAMAAGVVTAAAIADAAIDAATFAAGAIDATAIADGAIDAATFAAGAINAAAIAADAITDAKVAADVTIASVTGAVGSVTGNVGGNLVGTLSAAERNAISDALLARNVAGGSSTGRTVKEALAFLRNKWDLSAGTLTVYDTDDTTVLWTASITATAGADPVTGSDPA